MSVFRRQLNKYQSAILTNSSIGNNVTDFQKFLVKDFQKLIVLLDWIKQDSISPILALMLVCISVFPAVSSAVSLICRQ